MDVERLTGLPVRHVRTLYICIIPFVNKSLLTEVPYTGRVWQYNATKNNKRDSTEEQGDDSEASPQGPQQIQEKF